MDDNNRELNNFENDLGTTNHESNSTANENFTTDGNENNCEFDGEFSCIKQGDDGEHTGENFSGMADAQDNKEEVSDNRPHRKVHYNYRKSIAVGLAGALLCGAAMGFFFGVGINTSKAIFSAARNFSFSGEKTAVGDDDSVNPQNTVSDGVLATTNDDITAAVKKARDSIVNISIKAVSTDFFYQTVESEGSGSGIIYSQDDEKVYIVTNNHVVEGAKSVMISITGDESINASLVGKDAASDLAVISVLKSDLKQAGFDEVSTAVFGDSDEMLVGESVVAIGNALGQGKSATLGIISAPKKEINIDGKTLKVLQTDAAINPGNSGGALVNMSGEVIGINTAKLSSSAVEGTGYAIPTDEAKDIIQTLMENGTVDRAYLGISGSTISEQIKSMYNIKYDGVLIVAVEENSAAEQAGIKEYDIITAIDGAEVKSIEDLSQKISNHKSGDKVKIDIVRNGNSEGSVEVTLGSLNAQF